MMSEHVITPPPRFDFAAAKDVGERRKSIPDNVRALVIDLTNCTYLDSSALGILLMLRDHSLKNGMSIELRGPTSAVKQVLDIANFGKLFRITI